nr:reverse transcriptase domain-containing protein [Tanacetum cinerariifolium]
MSVCEENQKVKYTVGSFIGKALTWWNSQVQTRGREAVVGMTWDDFKTLTRDEFYPNNEIQKLETKFWCHVMVRVGHTAYTNRLHELARLVPHLVTPENKRIERKEYTGTAPKCPNCSFYHIPEMSCRKCTNYNRLGNFDTDYRARPRVVTPVNTRNLTAARGACFECGGTDHYKAACP